MKSFKEVIDGIRKAVMASEVREDLAQMGEYVEQFANTAGENIQKAIDPTLSLSGKAADAAKVGEAVGQIKEELGDEEIINRLLQNGESVDFTILGYLHGNGGYDLTTGRSLVTDWIQISENDKVAFKHLWSNSGRDAPIRDYIGIVCFYDYKKIFISSAYKYNKDAFITDVVQAPQNAKYVRLCRWDSTEGDSLGKAWIIKKVKPISNIIESKERFLESINKPFNFNNKTLNAFGDSITNGVTSPGLRAGTPYIKFFADHVNANLLNWSVSGSTLSYLASWEPGSICDKLEKIGLKNANDYIIISGGTNDFNQNREIGDFSSNDNATVCGALRKMCDYIKTNLPLQTVIFITPIPYTQAYYDLNNYINKKNELGYTLEDYRQAIYKIATAYGHSVVDGKTLGMPTSKDAWANLMCDNTDGCHPTAEGHKLYARSLAGKLL